ncbi:mutanase [Penicillium cf. griseofulvum]|uniref:Mutanase n=1 Tax=Penicillium cf. griseofulvum TaxID=2972120 RepID=A0A9W9IWS3_9EURO|nr:mutanase [Penicillium cf. griseofulvum]KAJ5429682.1 mutanase [Penicillium cf. griseofulvum]KAJ5436551.1 mutanase [Penicillium cf. griseofulvum]
MGAAHAKPKATGTTGYPAEGKDANYVGFCSFVCNYGCCPSVTCGTTEHPMPVSTVSDFLPPAYIAGTGDNNVAGLCSFACNFGYCPINLCSCTKTGSLIQPSAQTEGAGEAGPGYSKRSIREVSVWLSTTMPFSPPGSRWSTVIDMC